MDDKGKARPGVARGRGVTKPGRGTGRVLPAVPGANEGKPVEHSDSAPRAGQGLGRNLMSAQTRNAAASRVTRAAANAAAAANKLNEVSTSGQPAASSQAQAGAGVESEDSFAGTFIKDLPAMMYGYGDDASPIQETVEVVEAALLQFLAAVAERAGALAASSLKPKPDERDVMFVVRKDPAKFARIKELLVMQQVIMEVRAIDK